MLWWTVQNLAVTALLAGLVALACRAFRVGPVGRHALWVLVLVKMLTPPLVVWPWAVRTPSVMAPMAQAAPGRPAVAVTGGVAAPDAATAIDPRPATPMATPPTPPSAIQFSTDSPASDEPVPEAPNDPGTAGADPGIGADDPAGDTGNIAIGNGCRAAAVPPAAAAPVGVQSTESPPPASAGFHFERLLPWAGAAWAAGALLFLFVQAVRIVRMARSVRRGRPAGAELTARVEQLARRLRVRPVPVRVLPGLVSPVIWALARPRLLWPDVLPPGAADASVRGLILHELAHVKRRDHWVGWLELVAGCLWWWNPLFWYVRHQVRENAELACDAWVVQSLPEGRGAYARALLAVCECLAGLADFPDRDPSHSSKPFTQSKQAAPMPAVGVGTGGRRFIERRLTMILRERVPLRLPRLGLLSVVLLAAAALPAWAQRAAENPTNPTAAGAGGAGISDSPAELGIESVGNIGIAPPARPMPAPSDFRDYVANRRLQPSPLPDEARQLLRQFDAQQNEARRAYEEKLSRQRQDLIDGLQKLQDRYTKAGQLDEAVAVRDEIRRLRAAQPAPYGITGSVRKSITAPAPRTGIGSSRIRAAADPGTLVDYRDRVGQVFIFDVVGATDGTIWGTEVYTDDSPLATTAVHAGVLQPGQRGFVRVHILPALQRYQGSTANGVTSLDYGPWEGSYVVDAVPTNPTNRPPMPGSGGVGVYGNTSGSINRNGDSGSSALQPGSASSGKRNPYGGGSSGKTTGKTGSSRSPEPDPGTLYGFRGHTGQHFVFEVVGATAGTIWGDGVYTDDSPLATAAVHAGVLEPGQRGIVRVSILPGRDSYQGSTRNGVTSLPYGPFPGSYQVSPVLVPVPPSRPIREGDSGAYGALSPDRSLSGKPGESKVVEVVGSTDGPLWGTDVYTNDSSIGTAAVHAGLLKPGEKGAVLVTFLPGRDHYEGSNRNGVTSQPWTTPWDGSFRLTAHPPVDKTDRLKDAEKERESKGTESYDLDHLDRLDKSGTSDKSDTSGKLEKF